MGLRGPPPKPTALRLAQGNPSGRPLPVGEPVPPPGDPDVPEWLTPRGRQVWTGLVPQLTKIGLARTIDGGVLGRYCEMLVMWIDALAFVNKNGPTFAVRAGGGTKDKPAKVVGEQEFRAMANIRRLNRELLAIEREFGLTPAARTRINVGTEKSVKGDIGDFKRRFLAPKAERGA